MIISNNQSALKVIKIWRTLLGADQCQDLFDMIFTWKPTVGQQDVLESVVKQLSNTIDGEH